MSSRFLPLSRPLSQRPLFRRKRVQRYDLFSFPPNIFFTFSTMPTRSHCFSARWIEKKISKNYGRGRFLTLISSKNIRFSSNLGLLRHDVSTKITQNYVYQQNKMFLAYFPSYILKIFLRVGGINLTSLEGCTLSNQARSVRYIKNMGR